MTQHEPRKDGESLSDYCARRLAGGVLLSGKHEPNGQACALELVSQYRGLNWSDVPGAVGMPDVRAINDARWSSDAARTEAMLPLLESLLWWKDDDGARRLRFVRLLAVRTVNVLVAELPGLSKDIHARCLAAKDCASAANAAYAANAANAAYATYAASAANAAYAAAATIILKRACALWVECSEASAAPMGAA